MQVRFRLTALIFLVLTVFGPAWAQEESARLKNYNLRKGIGLQGYDPVSYFQGQPKEGKETITQVVKGVTYYFSSSANRDKFRASPERYEPAYGGWCAYAMGETGEKVKVDQKTFKIIDGRLYLFYNFWGNNTLESWNKNEANLKNKADQNWGRFFP